jgi:putative hydrolase of the HAD superfamily
LLIIFDLDDTLIDTTGCITPIKLEDALTRMVEAGLELTSFSEALEMLRRLDNTSHSAAHTLREFIEINHLEKKYLEIGLKEVYDTLPSEVPDFTRDKALEVLLELREMHEIALVTNGKSDQQLWKLKKAGIDSTIFSKLIVNEDGSKKPHYRAVAEELGFASTEVVVCGDRIATDLIPARELGFKTVHVRWGRGLNSVGMRNEADYTIVELVELLEIINSLMSFSSF